MIEKNLYIPKRKCKARLTRKTLVVYLAPIMFSLTDYTYILPHELIAQEATHPHHNAKLMVVNQKGGTIAEETTFWQLDTVIEPNRVLFLNNSKVLQSRLDLHNIRYARSNGITGVLREGEIFFLKSLDKNTFEALVRPGDKFKIGTKFFFQESVITVEDTTESGRILSIAGCSIFHLMTLYGKLPLPPYIDYHEKKENDYQTSFATKEGSVAAPTASLHFTQELLGKLQNTKYYTTLHVGLGTFKGIDTDDIRAYKIHEERAEVGFDIFEGIAQEKNHGNMIVAIGTTVCRTLESLPSVWKKLDKTIKTLFSNNTQVYWDVLANNLPNQDWIGAISVDQSSKVISFTTSIYIIPGYEFLIIDELITNFHLPESSLLVLVSALLKDAHILPIYQQAIERKYRFYSFGDGMYIRGKSH